MTIRQSVVAHNRGAVVNVRYDSFDIIRVAKIVFASEVADIGARAIKCQSRVRPPGAIPRLTGRIYL